MHRFTRLTNGFSKKSKPGVCGLSAQHALQLRPPHKTVTKAAKGYPTTPAMAAGVADQV
jgi:hypothetical protein